MLLLVLSVTTLTLSALLVISVRGEARRQKLIDHYIKLYRTERTKGQHYHSLKVFLLGHDFMMRNRNKRWQRYDMVKHINDVEAQVMIATTDKLPGE